MLNSVKKLERIKTGLYSLMEDLDSTYEECVCCHSRRYTSRVESLLKVTLNKLCNRIEKDIEKLRRYETGNIPNKALKS